MYCLSNACLDSSSILTVNVHVPESRSYSTDFSTNHVLDNSDTQSLFL